MISFEKALEILHQNIPAPQLETISLCDSLNKVIAEDVFSDIDMPPFDKSAMDGYAVRSDDIKLPPVELEVLEVVPAGRVPTKIVKPGKAIKIMTGAPLPQGADAVIMVEHTRYNAQIQTVCCFNTIKKSANICFKAEDIKKGEKVISQDTKITPQHIGLLASVGKDKLHVYKYPSITIITTGDELIDITQTPESAQIRNSNTYSLQSQLNKIGFKTISLGIVKDNIDILAEKISGGLKSDILILTGGVSMGDYDIVEEVLKKIDTKILFNQVAIKPGKPFVFGKNNNCLVFGLPGNPVSVFVITEVFIKELLSIVCKDSTLKNRLMNANLTKPIEKSSDRQQYILAKLDSDKVEPIWGHGSADIISLTKANAFIIMPPNSAPFPIDSSVTVMVL
ncbi:MAG: gephyrin-like molybdotransferase Glp [Planctomycetota bacterium]